ncbi:MAG TPA: FecR family protein [Burkholderiales bacterium]|nr:FecR family protein [Burkholderiales bacterium]
MKVSRIGLLMIVLALCATAHAEVVGRVLMAAGDASVIRNNEEMRVAVGFPIEDQDTLKTGPFSNMQVRFTDQSIVSLRDHSLLKIDEYKFDGKQDGLERAFFNLVKGGFRTITGLIGKVHKSNYGVKTATATIGIRGTNFALLQCAEGSCGAAAKDGLYGGVSGGIIAATNSSGEYQFGSGDYFFVPSKTEPPKKLIGPPAFFADRLAGEGRVEREQTAFGGSERQRNGGAASDGRPNKVVQPYQQQLFIYAEFLGPNTGPSVIPPSSTPTPTPPPPFVFPTTGVGAVGYWPLATATSTGFFVSGVIASNTSGQMIMINDPINNPSLFPNASYGGAQILDSGNNASAGNLTWGRWVGGSPTVNGSLIGLGIPILVYAIGDAPSLPASGTAVTYSPVGGTAPTNANNITGTFMGGSVTVNFVALTMITDLQIGFGGAVYNLQTPSTAPGIISTNGQFQGVLGGTCTGTCGPSNPTGANAGSFTGRNAAGLAMVYHFSDGGPNLDIAGAQGFIKR